MSTYRPKGSRTYWYDFEHDNLRYRRTTGATTKREAERVEKRVKAEIRARKHTGPGRPEMTLSAATTRYYTEVAEKQPSNDWTYYLLESCLKHLGENRKLSDIDQSTLSEFVATLRARVSDATSNRHMEFLRRLFKRAHKYWNVSTPEVDWPGLMYPEPDGRVRELSQDEEQRLFKNLRQDYHPIVRFCLLTGVRKNNALTLKWDQVDFAGRVIKLRIKSRKPGGRAHTIPMTGEIVALLSRERGKHDESVFTYTATKTRSENVRGRHYPVTRNGLRRAWERALKNAGISDFRFHDLRHTTATRLLRGTGNLKLAQRLLGHKDIATTAKYAHADDADLRSAMESLNPPMNPPKSSRADE